jgi:hypothetical protein
MADNLCPDFDADDLAELGKLPAGLLAEVGSFANKCGYRLAEFLAIAADPKDMLGFWLSRREEGDSEED